MHLVTRISLIWIFLKAFNQVMQVNYKYSLFKSTVETNLHMKAKSIIKSDYGLTGKN